MGYGSALFCYIVLFNLVEKVFVSLCNYLRNELFPKVLFEQKTLSYLRLSPHHTILKKRSPPIQFDIKCNKPNPCYFIPAYEGTFLLTVLVDSNPLRSNKMTFLNYCLKITLSSIP